jgi:hypothetical protein
MAEPEPSSPLGSPTAEELRNALKAFKKRLKLTRLDDESSLGRGPLSGGKSSGIVAITPPNQYPRAVWDQLVAQGRLKYAGQGMYQLQIIVI